MSNSFFVILPSNTPGFVGNKTNKFKVHLPKKLVFDGPGWMVGMSGIIYPNIDHLCTRSINFFIQHED